MNETWPLGSDQLSVARKDWAGLPLHLVFPRCAGLSGLDPRQGRGKRDGETRCDPSWHREHLSSMHKREDLLESQCK